MPSTTSTKSPDAHARRQRAPFTSPGSFQDLAIDGVASGSGSHIMANGGIKSGSFSHGNPGGGAGGLSVGYGNDTGKDGQGGGAHAHPVWGLTREGSRDTRLGDREEHKGLNGYGMSNGNGSGLLNGIEGDGSQAGYGHAGMSGNASTSSPYDYRDRERDRSREKIGDTDVVDLGSRQSSMVHPTTRSSTGNGSTTSKGFSFNSTVNYASAGNSNTGLPHRRAVSITDSLVKTLVVSPRSLIPTPSTIKFCLLCILWYASSAFSSNTGKVILNNFRFPVTLTIVQFWFVAAYCWVLTSGRRRASILLGRTGLPGFGKASRQARRALSMGSFGVDGGLGTGGQGWSGSTLRSPTRAILRNTWPMATFQVGGHIFSSMAISRVPVSTVHTIKALSPLFTVCAYAVLFKVSYSPATYLSLLPLTLGVMLACSFDMSAGNVFGLVCAFGSTIVFVSSNIVFKKLMPSNVGEKTGLSSTANAGASKLDKINLLFYSSGMAFVLMIPLWAYSDMPTLISMWRDPSSVLAVAARANVKVSKGPPPSIPLYFFLNCTVHFGQNLLAFAILSSVSPVTYSIASLVKRIAVICLAIVWFNQKVHPIQGMGIALTGLGLYMYNNAKRDVDKIEKKVRQMEDQRDGILPMTNADERLLDGRADTPPPFEVDLHLGKSSPKPSYDDQFRNGQSISVSSSIRTNGYSASGFQLPAQAYPQMNASQAPPRGKPYPSTPQGYVGAYPTKADALPSPPPSNTNSPPFTAAPPHIIESAPTTATSTASAGTARRRMSNDTSRTATFAPSQQAPAGRPSRVEEREEILVGA